MTNNLPHIMFSEEQERFDYTTPRPGRGSSNYPSRNEIEHGKIISRKLAEAKEKYDNISAVGVSYLDTIILEFDSAPGYDLKSISLEDMKAGIRLLNIQESNTEEFRKHISEVFETSTLKKPKVIAPLINYSKDDIVKIAMQNSMPLEYLHSCYASGDKHCGKCESCRHLKNALIANHGEKYLEILFE